MSYVDGGRVALAIVTVVAACAGGAIAVEVARRSRNWLYLVVAVGSALLVVGIVGQRTFPSEAAVRALGADAAGRQSVGLWDAGVTIPALGVKVTPVALAGLLIAVAGISLVLFFEAAPEEGGRPAPRPVPRLEDDDRV